MPSTQTGKSVEQQLENTEVNPQRVIEHYESPVSAMQEVEQQSNSEVGLIVRGTITGDTRFIRFESSNRWLEYIPETNDISLYSTNRLFDRVKIYGGDQAVVPVSQMPLWGDGTVTADQVF